VVIGGRLSVFGSCGDSCPLFVKACRAILEFGVGVAVTEDEAAIVELAVGERGVEGKFGDRGGI
jgi:hypothetical protein